MNKEEKLTLTFHRNLLSTHAKFLINYSAEELLEMERLASEVAP
jgi:hypothetical protein